MNKFVNADNPHSRPTGKYAGVIDQIAKDKVCPFCPEHLGKYHKNPIVEKKDWLLTDNMYPSKPTLFHKLIIHRGHISHFLELKPEEWAELFEIVQETIKSCGINGGTFLMRFGETKFSGASVNHLHAHIIQSDPDSADYDKSKGIIVRVG